MRKKLVLTRYDVRASEKEQVQEQRSTIALSEEAVKLKEDIVSNPHEHIRIMNLGLELSKQLLYREAVEAYSDYISYNPFDAIAYRHRGHRLISIQRFREATADLELASRLSPENWDIQYHRGLAHFLLGNYERAAEAYRCCYTVSKEGSQLVAVLDWYWTTLCRLGKRADADKLLEQVDEDIDYGENYSYYKKIMLYKGVMTIEQAMKVDEDDIPDITFATNAYGVSNFLYANGEVEKANELLRKILEIAKPGMWSSFAYLAALSDLKNRGLMEE